MHAAQVEHAAYVFRLIWQVGDFRPALDFAHRHDVDAVLIVVDRKADELDRRCRRAGYGARLPVGRIEGFSDAFCVTDSWFMARLFECNGWH